MAQKERFAGVDEAKQLYAVVEVEPTQEPGHELASHPLVPEVTRKSTDYEVREGYSLNVLIGLLAAIVTAGAVFFLALGADRGVLPVWLLVIALVVILALQFTYVLGRAKHKPKA